MEFLKIYIVTLGFVVGCGVLAAAFVTAISALQFFFGTPVAVVGGLLLLAALITMPFYLEDKL